MTSSLLTGPLTGLDAEALPASHGAEFDFGRYRHTLDDIDTFRCAGKVVQVIGLTVEAEGLVCEVGEICEVHPARGGEAIIAEVVGFRGDRVVLMPLGEMSGISPGSTVVATGGGFSLVLGPALVGRVIDGLGRPIDGKGPISGRRFGVGNAPPAALSRARITEPLPTGVRAIDGMLTCGRGQRLGIFAGSGVVAEYFREEGMHVSFLMDSVTRFAMAQREVGLTIGEPPATRGYTPSVFAMLPRLMERTGASANGTVTGFYTVLVEGDDLQEPITDAVRSILDGHIVLSREMAAENHYPSIDILQSISRLMSELVSPGHKHSAGLLREVLATYASARDLINIGAYASGSNPAIDFALAMMPRVREYLRQDAEDVTDFEGAVEVLQRMFMNV
ncbi:MAG: EscN/YscN/HrcN family type III secretion system ATPase [Chloroflexi bacterium]|nr:EscN/YscN/HrcN family type III secretion system ATPase [Chloroflexota bacterium]